MPGEALDSICLEIRLPAWLCAEVAAAEPLRSAEARMAFAIRLSELNVRNGTGGPFGAAVFESSTGVLIAAGVNLVVPSGHSIAHAEVIALCAAQRAIGGFDLGANGAARELVSSAEPCAMCLGALYWSGVEHVACAARGDDVEAIGFDEGPKPQQWQAALAARGIRLTTDVLRERAVAVLHEYRDAGGRIYNADASARGAGPR